MWLTREGSPPLGPDGRRVLTRATAQGGGSCVKVRHVSHCIFFGLVPRARKVRPLFASLRTPKRTPFSLTDRLPPKLSPGLLKP